MKNISSAVLNTITAKINIEIKDILGVGTCGTAFETKCGRVLKFTSQVAEAANSWGIIGGSLTHTATIFDVGPVRDTQEKILGYYILQEKVDTSRLAPVVRQLEDYAEDHYGDTFDGLVFGNNRSQLTLPEGHIKVLNNFVAACTELNKHDICGVDIASGNVGTDENGTFKIFDIDSDMSDYEAIFLDHINKQNEAA